MALTKSTAVRHVTEAVRQLDPEDRFVVTLGVDSGVNPWLHTLMTGGIAPGDTHFLTLTQRSILLHETGMRWRPGRLWHALPRDQAWARIGGVSKGFLWSSLRFHLPGDTQPTCLNVRRAWRAEMERFVDELAADATER